MALVINTNMSSILIQKNLEANTLKLNKNVERLSSGLRINNASDDAAGLAISEKLRAHVRSMNVAVRNAQDGISLTQTAEGGLKEVGNILVRMRELAQEAASGTLGASERGALDNEYQELVAEIDRISNVTEFNGTKLLDGTASAISLQVGFQDTANDRIVVDLSNDFDTTALSLTGTVSTISDAQAALGTIDTAINTVATSRGTLGAKQSRLDSTIANMRVSIENFSAAISRIRDADFATETAEFTKNQILVQSATAVLAQANVLPQTALQLLR